MRWQFWAVLVAAVFAGGAAVAGTLIATGLGGSDVARPTGAQTILRIEPVNSQVSCGPGGATVYIYLDDLAGRTSALNANVSYGLTSFEFPLRYDPSVLQIGPPSNIQLNPQLDLEDADRDGVVRSFIPVSHINDSAGWAMIGAASFNPSSQGLPGENFEEGLDPAAKGEPVLLMTVRLQTVGAGTSRVAIAAGPGGPFQPGAVSLFDPAQQRYEPVAVKDATITVTGGDCSQVARSTPRPTPLPTSTPIVFPTVAIPTPMPVTPNPAAQGGRPDCPQGWAVYRDPDGHFSLCYPPDWSAIAAPPDADLGTSVTLRAGEGVFLTLYWRPSSYFESPDFQDRCALVSWQDAQQITWTVAGRSVNACTGYETLHPPDAPPLRSTFAEIPATPASGYVTLFLTQAEGSAYATQRGTSESVLDSLRLGQ